MSMTGNGEAMGRFRCATIGVVSSAVTVALFLLGLALIMRFVDIRIESYPMHVKHSAEPIR